MRQFVAILEDDTPRIERMQAVLAESLPAYEVAIFADAQRMIDWLAGHMAAVVLVSLDHDLPIRTPEGLPIDSGTGRQVANYLASRPPTCPVIVHSSNPYFAPGMFFALKDAGWPCSRVYPSDDTAWIAITWGPEVVRYVEIGRERRAIGAAAG